MGAARGSASRSGNRLSFVMVLAGTLAIASSAWGQERPRRSPDERRRTPAPIRKLHQDPPGCDENALGIEVTRSPSDPVIVNGSTVNYTVTLKNTSLSSGGVPCNATGVTVSLTCPGPDGEPTGATTTFGTNITVLSGTTQTYGPVACAINVNPGVGYARARGDFNGAIHTAPPDDVASGSKTITVVLVEPTATATPTLPPPTDTPTATPTLTPSNTPSNTPTPSNTETPSNTPTPSNTATPSDTATPSNTPTATLTPSITPSATGTPSSTPTPSPTSTSTTPVITGTATQTPTLTATATPPGGTASPTPTITSGGPGGPGGPTPSVPIPTLDSRMLAMMAAAIAAVALMLLRKM